MTELFTEIGILAWAVFVLTAAGGEGRVRLPGIGTSTHVLRRRQR